MKFLKDDITTSQNLASAVLLSTTTYSKAFTSLQVLIKFSVNVTETITITLDSKAGASYDVVLRKKTLSAESSFVYESNRNFAAGDNIKIQCTNANATGTAYVIVKAKEVG